MSPSDHAGNPPGDAGRRDAGRRADGSAPGSVPSSTAASTGGQRAGAWVIATMLLAAAVAGSLVVPIYARSTPMLGDFPFFYWYQLLLVPVIAITSWLAYLLVRRRPGRPGVPAVTRTASAGAPDDRG